MAKYESKVKQIAAPVEQVYAMLSDLENLRPIIDGAKDNDAVRAQIEAAGQDPSMLDRLQDVRLTSDSIAIPAPMVGEISLRICEREENKCIKFETEQSPVAANMWIQVLPSEGVGTKMRLTLKADLNPMIKMMVGSKLESGVDKLADMLAMLAYAKK
jgi:carbon monoxide dehydrogenase subunit G